MLDTAPDLVWQWGQRCRCAVQAESASAAHMQTCRAASATSAMPSSWGRLHLELVVCELLHSLHNGKADDILHKGQEGACRATSTA